jgi:glycerol-3-phosphate dehydrogenase subunit B
MPATMWSVVDLLRDRAPGLLADFHGLSGYSARQVADNLRPVWPSLRTARVDFPGCAGLQVFPENAARSLELPAHREDLAARLRPLLGDAACLGLPALLGMHRPHEVLADLEARLGVRIFEIPTMPPSVPGLRLREAVEQGLPGLGVRLFSQGKARFAGTDGDALRLAVSAQGTEREVRCRGAVLATGRFLAGGLSAGRTGVAETVFGLPVAQPTDRSGWHRTGYFDPRGHPVNRAGVEVDGLFRPLGTGGGPAFPTLYAAGSVLAHQDWVRMKCGAGLALATALGAVEAFVARP